MTEPRSLAFGVNLNNREPLIAPDYGVAELLDLSEVVEGLGFDSVWVGDSLFSNSPCSAPLRVGVAGQRLLLHQCCAPADAHAGSGGPPLPRHLHGAWP